MRLLHTASAAIALSLALGAAQTARPNFSGVWKLQDGISGRVGYVVTGSELSISHTQTSLRLSRPDRTDSTPLTLTLDGKEHTLSLPAFLKRDPPLTVAYRTSWDGSNLVITSTQNTTSGRTGEPTQTVRMETLWITEAAFLTVRRELMDALTPSGPSRVSERSTYQRVKK